ncbi:unnamed protein product [Lactuca virosa]|uniref:Uncharacterized protein n=1 Tax=Lactuca virosa TaxID=75947 RepID=A0AAU9M4S0_9ASTR|nr:unnamed protein product [Lactuca virosa]
MSFFWVALVHLMAAVMGHGGDGGDEPPHPFGRDFGVHQIDAVPPRRRDEETKRRRGMTVNKKMHRLYEANGRQPLKIIFDMNTFVPIGDVYECFIREVGSYIWRDIALDKNTWKEVPGADRNGMFTYLSTYSDFQAISNDPDARILWASLNHRICQRVNKECRKKQVVKNRGGTCSYGSASFKNNLNKLEVFHRAHVNKQGEFVDPLVEQQYNALVAEVALQTQHIADFGGDPNSIDWIALFEKVLDARRGHVRGIGPKPSVAGTSAPTQWHSQSQTPQQTQDVDVNVFLQNPAFVTALGDIIRSFSKQVDNATNNDEENDDGDND